jgi:UDP-GlcNAc:undecaprenyl-phosphate GlcNAc-1-phosphate transferase
MRLGHGHRRAVVILWLWTAILSGLVLFPTFANTGNAVIPFAMAGLVVALYTYFHPGVRQRNATTEGLAEVIALDGADAGARRASAPTST